MSELTFAVRFAHAAGPDRPGQTGTGARWVFGRVFGWLFFFFFARARHALALALASPLFSSSPFLLSFSSFFSFVVARVLVPLPLPLHDLLPLNLLARRSVIQLRAEQHSCGALCFPSLRET